MIIDLELLKLQKADLLTARDQYKHTGEDGILASIDRIINILDAIQDEKNFNLAIYEEPKVLITVEGGIIQHVSANCDIKYVIIDYDDQNNDEPVSVSKISQQDCTIKLGSKFHAELFIGKLSPDEKRAKEALKEIDF